MRLFARVLLIALSLCAAPLAAQKQEALTLLRPDAVFDGETAVLRKGWAVLVRGNRIEAVGPDVGAPAEASVLELPGTTLMPGMIEGQDRRAHV